MNRRRLLLALAVVTPLAIFGAAKIAVRWRPVVIGQVRAAKRTTYYPQSAVRVGRNRVVAGGGALAWDGFDLASGARRALVGESVVEGTDDALQLRGNADGTMRLVIGQGGAAPAVYSLPNARAALDYSYDQNIAGWALSPRTLRVSPERNRIELLLQGVYYRWNRATRQLERHADIAGKGGLDGFESLGPLGRKSWAIARDGESVILPTGDAISRFSTRTGQRIARLNLPIFRGVNGRGTGDSPRLSTFGRYALFRWKPTGAKANASLFDTTRPRPLWQIEIQSPEFAFAFAPDEKTLALANPKRKLWEIRDSQTGAVIRTLPLVPDTTTATFSPDGATLYGIAGGKLYRQRAR